MKRRYELHGWLAGTYQAIGIPRSYWTRAGAARAARAERAADDAQNIPQLFDYTIRDNKTGKSWPA